MNDLAISNKPVTAPDINQLAAQAPTGIMLLQSAVEKGASLEQIEKFMELVDRQQKREAEQAFVLAMANFKKNPPTILKNIQVDFEHKQGGGRTSYSYADIGQVSIKTAEGLAQHGLSHRWTTEQLDGGKIKVTCILTHSLGHSERESLISVITGTPQMSDLQKLAGTRTYLERHTLLGVTGLATSEAENDGAGEAFPVGEMPIQTQKGKAAYPQESFGKNMPLWEKAVAEGKSSPDHIISMVSSKAQLSEEQIKKIKAIKLPTTEENTNENP